VIVERPSNAVRRRGERLDGIATEFVPNRAVRGSRGPELLAHVLEAATEI
jgi:hypothetical protein